MIKHYNPNKILILDFEATCWEKKESVSQRTEGASQDIIEAGICIINSKDLSILQYDKTLVCPVSSSISPFCTNLTGITQEDIIREGISFGATVALLRDLGGNRLHPWGSYGNFDRKVLAKECLRTDMEFPLSYTHINIKSLAAISLGLDRETGLDKILPLFGLEFEGTHHSGRDDAYNIAKLMVELIRRIRR